MFDDAPARLLAVDDSPTFVELMAEDLLGQGYEVETANSGTEALEYARAFHPDVILLDIEMPGMDGFETCFSLKADPLTEFIPVVFLTGHNAEEGSAMAAIAAGGADFVAKPYSPSILFSRVAAQVAASKRFRAPQLRDPVLDVVSREAARAVLVHQTSYARRSGRTDEVHVARVEVEAALGSWEHLDSLRRLVEKLNETVDAPDFVARVGASAVVFIRFGPWTPELEHTLNEAAPNGFLRRAEAASDCALLLDWE